MKNHSVDFGLTLIKVVVVLVTMGLAIGAAKAVEAAPQRQNPGPKFSKIFDPSTIGPGSVTTLRFTIDNGDTSPVANLAFTDNLPASVTIATPANASTTCGDSATLSAPAGGTTISLSSGGVGARASCTIVVDVTSSTVGTHTNLSGNLTSSAGNSGPASADLVVSAGRPGFTKSFSPSSVPLGGRSTLVFTIDNTSNKSSVPDTFFIDNLPSGMTIADPANITTTCGTSFAPPVIVATPGSSSIRFDFDGDSQVPAVAGGASCTIAVDVIGGAPSLLGNTSGNLFVNDPSALEAMPAGKASAVLTVTFSDIALLKSFSDDPVAPGGTVTLEFTINNRHRDAAATNMAFTDDLDAALSGLVARGTPISDVCNGSGTLRGTSTLSFSGGSLGPGESCTFSVSLSVPATAAPGAYPNVTSQPTATVNGDKALGNAASESLFVTLAPRVTKTFVNDPIGTGELVTLRFTIANPSPSHSVSSIEFTDNLNSTGIHLTVSALPPSNPCGDGSSLTTYTPSDSSPPNSALRFSGGVLGPGASCTLSATLLVTAGTPAGRYENTTSNISAIVNDTVNSGPPATDLLEVVGAPSLTKHFIDEPIQPGANAKLEFTVSHHEEAPAAARDIAFTDDLSTALAGLVATSAPQNDICGEGSQLAGANTLSFSGGVLAPGTECTFSVSVAVPDAASPGSYTNTTSVVSSTVSGIPAYGAPSSAPLRIAGLSLTKHFIGDPVVPGSTVKLEFTVDNLNTFLSASDITFTDHLSATIAGLRNVSGSRNNVCNGSGSISGLHSLTFSGGALGAGASCTFSVTLQVPAETSSNTYINTTSSFAGRYGDSLVTFDNALDDLVVDSALLALSKDFTDDPVLPGGTVTLQFTLTNAHATKAITSIAFTDDLDAVLSGLEATGLPVAACGGTLAGTSSISLNGGSLGPGATCTFPVALQLPEAPTLGAPVVNVTNQVVGEIDGLAITGLPASDVLKIGILRLAKAFDGPTVAGGTAVLSFTIENLTSARVERIEVSDDLDAAMPGLVARELPARDICGAGSQLTGTSFLSLANANLSAAETCTFSVTVQVPASSAPGLYTNTTSVLLKAGAPAGAPATARLQIESPPTFAKKFAPATVRTGLDSTLTFTIDNSASALAATNLGFSDNLPADLVVSSPPASVNSCGGTLTALAGAGAISLSGGSVAAGATCTISVNVTSFTPDAYVNTSGELTSSLGNSGAASAPLTVFANQLSVSDVRRLEGNAGDTLFAFTVTRTNSTVASSVDYATADGTAQAAVDYTAVGPDTLSFAAGGSLTRTIIINVTGELLPEANETFSLTLSNATNATIVDATGIGTIVNDDGATLSIDDVAIEESAGLATFTVSLSTASAVVVSVDFSTSDGTATAPGDYSNISGTITIPAGATTANIMVVVHDDAVPENAETFTVILSNAMNATVADATGIGTITDGDLAIVNISKANGVSTAHVGDTVTDAYQITRTGDVPLDNVVATRPTDLDEGKQRLNDRLYLPLIVQQ